MRLPRREIGLRPNTGPTAVITNLGIYAFEDREMVLKSVHAGIGVTLDKVKAETSWDLKVSPDLKDTEPPGGEELRVFREKIEWVRAARAEMRGIAPKR